MTLLLGQYDQLKVLTNVFSKTHSIIDCILKKKWANDQLKKQKSKVN